MAYLGPLSRVASTTHTAAIIASTSYASRVSLVGRTPKLKIGSDLCTSFQQKAISPVEARMSAAFITSSNWQQQSIQEYRFPSLMKPMNITVPAFHNGAISEKEFPSVQNIMEKIEPFSSTEIKESPSDQLQIIEKQAARLIKIRRKKMRKHKLRKLRKKMKFVWMKVKQKREYRKEKLFQSEQMAKIYESEAFDAASYVASVLRRTKEKPIPKVWKGKRLPEFLIKQLMEKEEEKKNRQL